MKIVGRLKGMAGIADQAIAAKALTAGCNYTIANNGPYDPVTAVYFATGNTMAYWYIVQALTDVGAGGLISQVTDPWAASVANETLQTSGTNSTQNINTNNVQSAQALLAGMDSLMTQSNVVGHAMSYANQAFAHMPASILTALGSPAVTTAQPTTAQVTTAQPAPAQVTTAVVTAPPAPAPYSQLLVTKPFEVKAPVPIATKGPTMILPPNPHAVVVTQNDSTSNLLMLGAAAAAAFFLFKK
jgi:hypothetical protein